MYAMVWSALPHFSLCADGSSQARRRLELPTIRLRPVHGAVISVAHAAVPVKQMPMVSPA